LTQRRVTTLVDALEADRPRGTIVTPPKPEGRQEVKLAAATAADRNRQGIRDLTEHQKQLL